MSKIISQYLFFSSIYYTHSQPFNGPWSGTTRVGRYQKKHPLTPILIIGHPLSTSSIYYDPQYLLCSVYVLDSPLWQPLIRSSLVFLLVSDPVLHIPCISSPSHHLFEYASDTLNVIDDTVIVQYRSSYHSPTMIMFMKTRNQSIYSTMNNATKDYSINQTVKSWPHIS